jgi:D-sedoheptulose 7-phosphate isomerase
MTDLFSSIEQARFHTDGDGLVDASDDKAFAVSAYLRRMIEIISRVDENQLTRCFEILWRAWKDDRVVFIVGNGGSASTASHMANDLSKQAQVGGRMRLRALALTDNVEALTAFANDAGYENVFGAQLKIHARPGDVLVVISCSGNSPNLIRAIDVAKQLGLKTIAFGGMHGGRTSEQCDHYVHVPSDDYGHIETAHLLFEHLLTDMLRNAGETSFKSTVLIDRDGVIVKNRSDYVKTRMEMEIIPGALESIAALTRSGHRVFVVTNQSAIGRGFTTRTEVDSMHRQLAFEASSVGAAIEAFLVCPHSPDDACGCRKPAPGLLYQARDKYGVDLETAVMIGDMDTDIQAARSAGCTSIRVLDDKSGHPSKADADHNVKSLSEAVALIVSRNGSFRIRS